MMPAERDALNEYVGAVRRHYGARIVDILIFGSRARGDEGPDSDADVAVVLEDGDWQFWTEKMRLSGLAYDVLLKHGLYIQPWPIGRTAWESPATHGNRRLIEAIRQEGRRLAEVV
jgi:predicted nucleotidyltransferase